jgi:hypothetical protein
MSNNIGGGSSRGAKRGRGRGASTRARGARGASKSAGVGSTTPAAAPAIVASPVIPPGPPVIKNWNEYVNNAPSSFIPSPADFSKWRIQAGLSARQAWADIVARVVLRKPITVETEAASNLVLSFGMKPRLAGHSVTTHPIARVCRRVAELLALNKLIAEAKHLPNVTEILDLFGSERFLDSTASMLLPYKGLGLGLQVNWYRPLITPKDHAVYQGRLVSDPSKQPGAHSLCMVTDVYMPVEELLELFLNSGSPLMVVVTQIHHGEALAGTKFRGEGIYYLENDLIHQYSGEGETLWTPTPENSYWMTHNAYSAKGVTATWNVDKVVRSYSIILVRRVESVVIPTVSSVVLTEEDLIVERVIEKPNVWEDPREWFLAFFKRSVYGTPLQVFQPAFEILGNAATMSSRQAFKLSSITGQVNNILDAEKYQRFWRVVPFDKNRVATDTITYIMWKSFNHDMSVWSKVTGTFGDAVETFKLMRSKVHSLPKWDITKIVNLGALLVLLLSLLSLRFRSSPKNVFMVLREYFSRYKTNVAQTKDDCLILGSASKEVARSFCDSNNKISLIKENVSAGIQYMTRSVLDPDPINLETVRKIVPTYTDRQAIVAEYFSTLFIVLAPYYEEWLKSKIPGLWLLIGFIESGGSIPRGLSHGYAHFVFQNSADPVANHGVHNMWVFTLTMLGMSAKTRTVPNRLNVRIVVLHWLLYAWRKTSCVTALLATSYGAEALEGRLLPVIPPTEVPPPAALLGFLKTWVLSFLAWITKSRNRFETEEDRFRADYDNNIHIIEDYESFSLPVERAMLPASTDAPPQAWMPEELQDNLPAKPVYVLLGSNAMMRRPHGIYHFYHAYHCRNLCEVPISDVCEVEPKCAFYFVDQRDPLKKCHFRTTWERYTTYMCGMVRLAVITVTMESRQSRLEWTKHFKTAAKRARAAKAKVDREAGHVDERSGIFLKSDEVLFPREKDGYTLKGRTVKAVSPYIQVECAPYMDLAMRRLKVIFDGRKSYKVAGVEYTIAIGSGKVSHELDEWWLYSMSWVSERKSRMACIVAGDDFYSIANLDGVIEIFEEDYSRFDRTQGVHALYNEAAILVELGVPYDVLNRMFRAMFSKARYEVKSLDYVEHLIMPEQRATGAPDTTIGNTINRITAIFFIAANQAWREVETYSLKLGFVSKLTVHSNPFAGTFLKGWWMPCTDGLVAWLPLPSQAVKVGKILRDPCQIYKNVAPQDAWEAAALAMAKSYGTVPFSYPIFGTLLMRYHEFKPLDPSLTRKGNPGDAFLMDEHKIRVTSNAQLEVSSVLELFEERYGLSEEDLESMRWELIRTSFPGIACHRGFVAMADKDYG